MIISTRSNSYRASSIFIPNDCLNHFDCLPGELIRHIFSYLAFQTVQKVRLTCRVFHNAANDPALPCYQWIFTSTFVRNLEKSEISKDELIKKYAYKNFFRDFCNILSKENKLDAKLLELAAEQGSNQAMVILVDLKHLTPSRIKYFAQRGFESAIYEFLLYSLSQAESWIWEEYFANKKSPAAIELIALPITHNPQRNKNRLILLENLAEQGVEAAIRIFLKCHLLGLLGLENTEKFFELAHKYIDKGSEAAIKELIENCDIKERRRLAEQFAEKKSISGVAELITGHIPISLTDPIVELSKTYAALGYECAIHQLCVYYSKILNTDPTRQLELIEPYAEKGSEGAITVLLSLPLPKEKLLQLAVKYLKKGSIAAAQNLVKIFHLC